MMTCFSVRHSFAMRRPPADRLHPAFCLLFTLSYAPSLGDSGAASNRWRMRVQALIFYCLSGVNASRPLLSPTARDMLAQSDGQRRITAIVYSSFLVPMRAT